MDSNPNDKDLKLDLKYKINKQTKPDNNPGSKKVSKVDIQMFESPNTTFNPK